VVSPCQLKLIPRVLLGKGRYDDAEGEYDFLIEVLKIERREENGRERKIKDRCFGSGGVEKPDSALQLLRKQG
jgi:hypothetical protein